MLYGVGQRDVPTFIGVAALIAVVASAGELDPGAARIARRSALRDADRLTDNSDLGTPTVGAKRRREEHNHDSRLFERDALIHVVHRELELSESRTADRRENRLVHQRFHHPVVDAIGTFGEPHRADIVARDRTFGTPIRSACMFASPPVITRQSGCFGATHPTVPSPRTRRRVRVVRRRRRRSLPETAPTSHPCRAACRPYPGDDDLDARIVPDEWRLERHRDGVRTERPRRRRRLEVRRLVTRIVEHPHAAREPVVAHHPVPIQVRNSLSPKPKSFPRGVPSGDGMVASFLNRGNAPPSKPCRLRRDRRTWA